MPLRLSDVSVLGSLTTIQLDGTDQSLNGVFLGAGTTNLIRVSGGTPTKDISQWEFDPAATPANPVRVQVQGAEVTFVVDPSVPARIAAGEVIFEAVDPFWTPANLPGIQWHFSFPNSGNYVASPWTFTDEIGNTTIVQSGTQTTPTYNSVDGTLDFANSVLELNPTWDFIGQSTAAGFFASFASVNSGRVFRSSNSFQYIAVNENGRGLGVRRNSSSNVIWDGLLDPEDLSLPYERRYVGGSSSVDIPYRHAAVSTEIPSNTPVFFICSWQSQSDPLRDLGQNNSARYRLRQVGLISNFNNLSVDDKLRLQAYLTWDLVNAGLANIADLMDANHPHYSGPPTLIGGGTSSFTITVPQTIITFTGLMVGAEIIVRWSKSPHQILKAEATGSTFAWVYEFPGFSQLVDIDVNLEGFQTFKLRNFELTGASISILVSLRESTAYEASV